MNDHLDAIAFAITETPSQVCVRCGHRSKGCPRCGRVDPLLGGRIKGEFYCHLQSKRSCYTLTLWELGFEAFRKG